MELSKEEVGRIDQFLKDKQVKHLDLRLELIDHLSTEIEDLLKRVSVKSFDEAFLKIEGKYTGTLLENIKKNKVLAMNDYWRGKFKEFWKSYFSLPKIMVTILLFIVFLSLKEIPFRSKSLLTSINILLGMSGLLISLFALCRSLLSSKRLIIVETYATILMLPYMGLQFVYQLETSGNYSPAEHLWLAILLSFVNTIFLIGIVGNFTSFRYWIKEEIGTTYPLINSIK